MQSLRGRRKGSDESYQQYLQWLAQDKPAQRAREFEKMSRGWVLGSREFQQALVAEERAARVVVRQNQAQALEARQIQWEADLQRCLRVLGRKAVEIATAAKSADWKVAIAAHMETNGLCPNRWLAQALNMGVEFSVSRYVGEMLAGKREPAAALAAKLTAKVRH